VRSIHCARRFRNDNAVPRRQKAAKEKEKEDVATLKPRKLKSAAAPVEKTQLHSLLRDLTGHEVDDDSHVWILSLLSFLLNHVLILAI
jgi:hypothetical protein